jgi:hypothetical protein
MIFRSPVITCPDGFTGARCVRKKQQKNNYIILYYIVFFILFYYFSDASSPCGWVVLKMRVGAVTSQRILEVLFYVNIVQCFFVVDNFTANAVSVAIGDNGNRLIFEIWWNFFYDLFSIKNVADVNNIDSFVSKRNIEELSVVIMKRFKLNWFEKTKRRHVTYNTRQSVLRRKRIYASFVKSKMPKLLNGNLNFVCL